MSNSETSYELHCSLGLQTLQGFEYLIRVIGKGNVYLSTVLCR